MRRDAVFKWGFIVTVVLIILVAFSFKPLVINIFKTSIEERAAEMRKRIAGWMTNDFIEIESTPAFEEALASVSIENADALNAEQSAALRSSLKLFLTALNGGGYEIYRQFRKPMKPIVEVDYDRSKRILLTPKIPYNFPKLDGTVPTNRNPVRRFTPEQVAKMSKKELRETEIGLFGGGSLVNPYFKSFAPSPSNIKIHKVKDKPQPLSDIAADAGHGQIEILKIDLIAQAEAPAFNRYTPEASAWDDVQEKDGYALVAYVNLLIDYHEPDPAGPIFVTLYWDTTHKCWQPLAFLQVGLFRETPKRIPY